MPRILYEARLDGLWIFADGAHVGTIPPQQYAQMIEVLAGDYHVHRPFSICLDN
ncbi:MAG: hypothetical protein JKX69_06915 [Rhodobacteraceae bacterium]|nr:hypothetical protein [Paracoccaceae bacterium]